MKILNVLVACEESQRVCMAFRKLGHNAYSCDIQEESGGHPEWHIRGDCLPPLSGDCAFTTMGGGQTVTIDGKWDLIIAHPPCTYLSNAGACRLYPQSGKLDETRYKKGLAAKKFFMQIWGGKCKYLAVENPIPSKVFGLPSYTQVIQPYEYGHPYTKKTCLWLKNLPKLTPTKIVEPVGGWVCGNSEIWKKQAKNGEVIGKEKDPKHRSKTFEGIAAAMADRWSAAVLAEYEDKRQMDIFDFLEAD